MHVTSGPFLLPPTFSKLQSVHHQNWGASVNKQSLVLREGHDADPTIFKVLKSVKDFAKAFLIRDVSICCFCSMVTKDALSDAVGKLAVHQKQCKMGAKPRLEVNNHSAGLIQCIPRYECLAYFYDICCFICLMYL